MAWTRYTPVAILLLAAVLVAGCGAPTATPPPTAAPTPRPTAPPTPTPEPTLPYAPGESPLTGLPLDPEAARYPPLALLIPSDADSYGLSQASLVYEAVTEGNVPRYLAIFEQLDASQVGPIRSARPYHIEWACPYGALLVHWGGSPPVFPMLARSDCLANLEAMTWEGGYFWRTTNEPVPWNNLFTSSELLYGYLENWEITRFLSYRGFPHKEDASPESRPVSATIEVTFDYPVRYAYEAEQNEYLRFYQGRPQIDRLTGAQLRVKNLAILFAPQRPIPGDQQGRIQIETTGQGKALFCLDGRCTEGTWSRAGPEEEFRFLDTGGQELRFNRGNIWIEVLAVDQEVSYTVIPAR